MKFICSMASFLVLMSITPLAHSAPQLKPSEEYGNLWGMVMTKYSFALSESDERGLKSLERQMNFGTVEMKVTGKGGGLETEEVADTHSYFAFYNRPRADGQIVLPIILHPNVGNRRTARKLAKKIARAFAASPAVLVDAVGTVHIRRDITSAKTFTMYANIPARRKMRGVVDMPVRAIEFFDKYDELHETCFHEAAHCYLDHIMPPNYGPGPPVLRFDTPEFQRAKNADKFISIGDMYGERFHSVNQSFAAWFLLRFRENRIWHPEYIRKRMPNRLDYWDSIFPRDSQMLPVKPD